MAAKKMADRNGGGENEISSSVMAKAGVAYQYGGNNVAAKIIMAA
jgi:hypothetical protein